jgi:IS30 family transposase
VNRNSGTASANGGWLRRLAWILGFKLPVRQNWRVKYHQLSTEERYEIAALRGQQAGVAEMAKHLGRHRSTIYREVKRNQSVHDGRYRASHSVEKASGRKHRSRRNWLYGPTEFEPVETLIRQRLSPEQIVGRRLLEGQAVMSHETIYRWIWADKRCGGSLWRNLRGARKQRRKRYGQYDSRGRLAGKKPIEQRPAVVASRERIGDWEIDTVHGCGTACVVTVVERKTGLLRMGPIQRATKEQTLDRTVKLLWAERDRVKTITADNGTEFHSYLELESILDTAVYFATPHHAWERGTNENTNGLIRQYLPKGTNLNRLTQQQCDRIAEQLNNRPRLRLGFMTPNEVFYDQFVALQT